jgi:phospholipid/cholesterol/gamma-HCH transport system substrate-binding protein
MMMGRNVIETILGAVVLLVAGWFLAFAFKSADLKAIKGYPVTAVFQRADGLKTGSDVMVNGVKVGQVLGQELITAAGRDQYYVRVTLTVEPAVLLPLDTVATIANESLLGGRYLSLDVGVEDAMIPTDGTGRLTHTQPPIRLDDLIGKLLFSNKTDDKKTAAAPVAAAVKTDPADHP